MDEGKEAVCRRGVVGDERVGGARGCHSQYIFGGSAFGARQVELVREVPLLLGWGVLVEEEESKKRLSFLSRSRAEGAKPKKLEKLFKLTSGGSCSSQSSLPLPPPIEGAVSKGLGRRLKAGPGSKLLLLEGERWYRWLSERGRGGRSEESDRRR